MAGTVAVGRVSPDHPPGVIHGDAAPAMLGRMVWIDARATG